MTSSDTPRPHRTPEDEGIPDYADDSSTAYDEADRPRFNDSPYPLPADDPRMLEEHGVTAAEQRQGESLDERLDEEEPEVAVDAPWPRAGGALTDEAVGEAAQSQAARDAEMLGLEPEPTTPGTAPAAGFDEAEPGNPVGRLIEPDEGARPDTEAQLLASDAPTVDGGMSAEEDAMHELSEEDFAEDDVWYEP